MTVEWPRAVEPGSTQAQTLVAARQKPRHTVDDVRRDEPSRPVSPPVAVPTPARRTSWSAADLLRADFPEPRWTAPGIVGEGLSLLVGPPKLGKSWLALDVAAAVAYGGTALGRIDVDPGGVAYLALEDNPRRLASRLRVVLGDASAPAALFFETEWPSGSDGLARLDALLGKHPEIRLLVVDVFAKLRGPVGNGNAYAGDYGAAGGLKGLADRHGVAVLAVHHTRKADASDFVDEVSGTHGIAGAADTILLLKRERADADATLHVTGRDVTEAAYAMRFRDGAWSLLDGPASDYALGDTRRDVLRLVRERAAVTPKDVAESLGIAPGLARQTLRRMANAGQIDSDGRGTYFESPTSTPVTPVTAVTEPQPPPLQE